MFRILVKGLLAVSSLAAFCSAQAIPIVGQSGGSFSSLSSCDSSGSDATCRIVSTSNGPSTQVQWGSTSGPSGFVNPSTLTAVDVNINTDSDDGLGVVIGRLDWYNSATVATSDISSFGVAWSLALQFLTPSGPDPLGSELFNLTVYNTINPAGDLITGLTLGDLSGLRNSVNLGGVTISNVRYSGATGSWWYNGENHWSSLYILADFLGATSTSVPEPGTLGLLGLSLAGMLLASGIRTKRLAAA